MTTAAILIAVFVVIPIFIGCCIHAGSAPNTFPILPEDKPK